MVEENLDLAQDGIKLYSGGRELARAGVALGKGLDTTRGRARRRGQGQHDAASMENWTRAQQLKSAVADGTSTRSVGSSMTDLAAAAQQLAASVTADTATQQETLTNHALMLQEMASRVGPGLAGEQRPTAPKDDWQATKTRLLQQAVDKFEAAAALRPSSPSALYNWGVALSDLGLLAKAADRGTATACLESASAKYEACLKAQPHNPQALNNWGLALRELSMLQQGSGPDLALMQAAVARFRASLRIAPDFDRACYNLGTVLFNYANALASQGASATSWAAIQETIFEGAPGQATREQRMRRLHASAGLYLVLAAALQPGKEVYQTSLRKSGLLTAMPLPNLKEGFLAIADVESSCTERWTRRHVALNHVALRSVPEGSALDEGEPLSPRVPLLQVADIYGAHRVADPSLPRGAAFWVALKGRPAGVFFVADSEEEAEGFVDALHMVAHIIREGRLGNLRQLLTA